MIKFDESFADNKAKNETEQLFLKCKHGTIFMNTKNE